MHTGLLGVASVALLAASLGGCSCSEIYLSGDTGSDTIPVDPGSDPDGMDSDSTDAPPTDTAPVDTPPTEIPDLSGWDPYADHMGDPGWRDSTEPFCDEPDPDWLWYYTTGYDVWSDARGVYAFFGNEYSVGPDEMRVRIYMNDGAGWSVLADLGRDDLGSGFGFSQVHLTGIPGGALMLFPEGGNVALLDGGVLTMTGVSVNDLFLVDASLGYATLPAAPRLAHWDGSTWAPFPGDPVPYDVEHVWADHESIFCAGRNGTMLSSEEDGGWVVHDARTMGSFAAIWGSSREDVWASTHEGALVHFDGELWQAIEWPDLNDDSDLCRQHGQPILGMWGAGGIVFMHTMTQLLVWDGASFTTLGFWPGSVFPECAGRIDITAIWGNSPTEVFLAVGDAVHEEGECGRHEYLLWWDGAEFHWF